MGIAHRPIPKNCIDQIRCPAIQGMPRETVHMLHDSLVGLVYLRRSIEHTQLHVDRSLDAVRECEKLLHRLRMEGF